MTQYALVGDIGGTNARFALVRPGAVVLEHVDTLQCSEYDNIDVACRAYFSRVGIAGIERACLAFACPVQGEVINMTNNHWHFTRTGLAQQLGLKQLKLVNDFTAMALGMLHIDEDEKIQVGAGRSLEGAARLVIGPGTGLGVSGLVKANDDWIPLSTEGGHISFAPADEVEIDLWRALVARFGRVSVERILCGQGLLNLYQILSELRGSGIVCQSPAAVSVAAVEGRDPVAVDALSRFCRILGGVAGDNVLTLGARGGVYLCGGILPRVAEFLLQSEFRRAFEDKGRFTDYMQAVPVWLCTAENPGLLGAAAALDNSEVIG
ncbi:glucokinase [Amphritea pacifica]|uniref:Glucokinase n=1 Tax=Amphritea pacifica TaxID=2811233 RepID=A0ABS2W766_9GAMM|nr:glucokinase [Amphritea pacifica]MBN0987476.1 glucokinase [Amphritea pacifica]MBN1005201.1 glucokinase [Amphritea pacifica]